MVKKKVLSVLMVVALVTMAACSKGKVDAAFNLASAITPNAMRLAMLSGVNQITESTIASASEALTKGKTAYDAWDDATGPDKSNKWKDVEAAITIIQSNVVDIFKTINVSNPNVQTGVQLGLTVATTVIDYVLAQSPTASPNQKKAVRQLDVGKTKKDFNEAVAAASHPELAVH